MRPRTVLMLVGLLAAFLFLLGPTPALPIDRTGQQVDLDDDFEPTAQRAERIEGSARDTRPRTNDERSGREIRS